MLKRILAFIMCAAMALGMIGCSDKIDLAVIAGGGTRSDNAPITLSLYVPSKTKLKEETRLAVEEALNAISVKKFNTTIKFFAYPEEEYIPIILSKVQSEMNAYVNEKSHNSDANDMEILEEFKEVTINFKKTYGENMPLANMTDYPELNEVGIDIFVAFDAAADSPMRDPDSTKYNPLLADSLFDILYESRALEPISPRLINDYAILKSKSYPEFFEEVTARDIDDLNNDKAKEYAYAMPNNYILGYYEYLLIDEAVVSNVCSQDYQQFLGYYIDEATGKPINSVATLEGRIAQLKKDIEAKMALGDEAFAGLTDSVVEFESYEAYQEYIREKNKCAIAKVKGDNALPEIIETKGIEVVKCGVSEYNDKEIASSMYCISRAYDYELEDAGFNESDRVNRCLDILMLIQNDVDFRNTLQYGVKGEHYTITRDNVVHTSADDYVMDPARLGNMFLLYPCADKEVMSESVRKMAENNWRLAKLQNREILDSKPDPTTGG